MQLKNSLVILDLETTGTWVDKDKIIEIAMIKLFPDGAEEKYCRKVNPQMKIPPVVTQLTGITNADVQGASVFKDLADEILSFIGEADLAGFNVERFDLPLLEREFNECGRHFPWRHKNIYDAQRVFHLNERRDLTAAYQFYCQKELIQAHSALKDAEATLDVLKEQVKQYAEPDKGLESLKRFKYPSQDHFYDSEGKFRWWNGQLYIMFGKYARKCTLPDVVQRDPKYLEWVLSANFSAEIKSLVEDALSGKFPRPPEE